MLRFGPWLLFAVCLLRRLTPPWPINHDCGWYLYVAERVLEGDGLYRGVLDVNPPLIVYLSAVPVCLARWFDAPVVPVFQVCVMTLIAAVLVWSYRLARRLGCRLLGTPLTVSVMAYALAFVPGTDFGQREHLAVLFGLPLILVMAWRYEGRQPPRGHAFAAGLFAACGLCLKPYFLLAPALLVLLLPPRRGTRFPPEVLGLSLGTAIYGAHLFVVPYRDAFFEVVELVRNSYDAYRISVLAMLGQEWTLRALACAIGLTLCVASARRRRRMLAVFGLTAWAFVVAAVWQSKGWSYHLLPGLLFALMGLALAVLGARLPWTRELLVLGLLGCAALPLGQRWLQRNAAGGVEWADRFTGLPAGFEMVADVRRGGAVLVLDTQLPEWFAYLRDSGLRSGSRLACLWPLPGADAQGRARLLAMVDADLRHHRPAFVFVRVGTPRHVAGEFEIGDWLRGAAAWRDYERVGRAPGFTVWRRRT